MLQMRQNAKISQNICQKSSEMVHFGIKHTRTQTTTTNTTTITHQIFIQTNGEKKFTHTTIHLYIYL